MLFFLYHTVIGRQILKILCKPNISALCGKFLDSGLSLFLVKPFVKKNHIDLMDYETGFRCFNDCFSRRIKPGFRLFSKDPNALCAPCDGLLSIYRISDQTILPVKQSRYSIPMLLKNQKLADTFTDGYCLVYRLCVDHYHRYAYFDDCRKGENVFIPGVLHTVRPVALAGTPVFVQNCREYTVMETEHFGTAVEVEVGAMLVGKICNHHGAGFFSRGEEKGCFQYGGSTIIVLLEKDRVVFSDIFRGLIGTGEEFFVHMGDVIGRVKSQ